VSETKLEKVGETLNGFLAAETVTPRLLAKIAERIIPMGPAVLPASLFSRPLFQAMQGKLSWDQVFATPEEAKDTTRLFVKKLLVWNGRRWFPRRVLLEASSDASNFGFGGVLKVRGKLPFELVGFLSEAEIRMSSTAREMIGFLRIP
jgi:hypothetical protein